MKASASRDRNLRRRIYAGCSSLDNIIDCLLIARGTKHQIRTSLLVPDDFVVVLEVLYAVLGNGQNARVSIAHRREVHFEVELFEGFLLQTEKPVDVSDTKVLLVEAFVPLDARDDVFGGFHRTLLEVLCL